MDARCDVVSRAAFHGSKFDFGVVRADRARLGNVFFLGDKKLLAACFVCGAIKAYTATVCWRFVADRLLLWKIDFDMVQNMLLQRISTDPQICFGKPCIRGTRIWVSLILDMLSVGTSIPEILAAYPHIEREDVLACIAYGSAMSHEHYVEVHFQAA